MLENIALYIFDLQNAFQDVEINEPETKMPISVFHLLSKNTPTYKKPPTYIPVIELIYKRNILFIKTLRS